MTEIVHFDRDGKVTVTVTGEDELHELWRKTWGRDAPAPRESEAAPCACETAQVHKLPCACPCACCHGDNAIAAQLEEDVTAFA